jgi:hypothetical protein
VDAMHITERDGHQTVQLVVHLEEPHA